MAILYSMIACQLVGWGWFSLKAGKMSDKEFLIFTISMLLGQSGAAIETFFYNSWGAFASQLYFFIFTLYGGYKRYTQIKTKNKRA